VRRKTFTLLCGKFIQPNFFRTVLSFIEDVTKTLWLTFSGTQCSDDCDTVGMQCSDDCDTVGMQCSDDCDTVGTQCSDDCDTVGTQCVSVLCVTVIIATFSSLSLS